mmetsp:Transcript_16472/g.29708  ORF Transcript_16472/g.29708 Transcript_16472/m.29708 type:complete len:159 (-) Transcript_16472:1546-2022(-)
MQSSPLIGLLLLNHKVSQLASARLEELPLLKMQVGSKESELNGSLKHAMEQRALYERESDTLKRNVSMLESEVELKDKEIRGLRKELDSKNSSLETVSEELLRAQAIIKRLQDDQQLRERAFEHELSTLRLRHEQELFILKKMSSSSAIAKKPVKAKP